MIDKRKTRKQADKIAVKEEENILRIIKDSDEGVTQADAHGDT